MQSLTNEALQKTYFNLVEGSNYKITQINRKEHVVEFEQFKKLAAALNDPDTLFVTINNGFVNKNRIEDIYPTKALTEKEEMARIKAKKKIEREQWATLLEEQRFQSFATKYMDEHFDGIWTVKDRMAHMDDIMKLYKASNARKELVEDSENILDTD